MAASRVLGGSGGLGLLMSGLPSMIIAFMVLYSFGLVISPKFYDLVAIILVKIGTSFRQTYSLLWKKPQITEEHELLISHQEEPQTLSEMGCKNRALSSTSAVMMSIGTVTVSIIVAVLQYVRPISPPYAHMSGSLPVTLIEAVLFQPINSEFCLPHPVDVVLFPYDRFTKFFGKPADLDWMPMSDKCRRENGPGPPPWVGGPGERGHPSCETPNSCAPWPPGEGPSNGDHGHGPPRHRPHHGPPPPHSGPPHPHSGSPHPPSPPPHPRPPPPFEHHKIRGGKDFAYSFSHLVPPFRHGQGRGAVGESPCEPLAQSNLNASIVEALAKGVGGHQPKIKNVLLFTLESTRKDIFPLIKGNHMYKTILSTYSSENATGELDARLRGFADNAAFLTGQDSGFGKDDEELPEGHWRRSFKDGKGVINFDDATTQAAYTLKSLVSSHCGVEPLAVDFAEETQGLIYQPCLPQIFDKMSTILSVNDTKQELRDTNHNSLGWESAYIQSVTDQFDNQYVLNEQMGFKKIVTERTISSQRSKHWPPKQPHSNYFGFPEDESLEYFRDLFTDANTNNKRLFVSHLTSTPHHPFTTPKAWTGTKNYLQSKRWRPENPLQGYLNTIQYQDEWISQVLQMMKDIDVLDETLIIMTGDHGLAFNSPDGSQSAVNNGHISNFRIPLLFIHPSLPRIQLNASTTPLSILPTILDILVQTNSLPEPAAAIANEILPQYMGNSLIRDLDFTVRTGNDSTAPAFFQPFHFGAINPGGSLIAISDGTTTYRLILPLCSNIPLRFTDISIDPYESDAIEAWTMDELVAIVRVRHGERAKDWAHLAQEMGRWWVWKQREKWGYWGNARETSRGGGQVGGSVGRIKKEHWWETKR